MIVCWRIVFYVSLIIGIIYIGIAWCNLHANKCSFVDFHWQWSSNAPLCICPQEMIVIIPRSPTTADRVAKTTSIKNPKMSSCPLGFHLRAHLTSPTDNRSQSFSSMTRRPAVATIGPRIYIKVNFLPNRQQHVVNRLRVNRCSGMMQLPLFSSSAHHLLLWSITSSLLAPM